MVSFFFFSSRRRHTRCSRDWSSDVCSSDLHGNLFAAANFFHEASKRDVKPIIGCEVYVARGSRHERGEKTNGGNGQERGEGEPGTRGSNHLVLLCENLEGYHNLIKLVSAGFLEGFYYKPRIDYDLL